MIRDEKSFALPNHIYNEKFIGSNNLIKTGSAKLVCCLQDILDELPPEMTAINPFAAKEESKKAPVFSSKEE